MRLFEAIIEANHRAVAGDASAGLHPAEFAAELPLVALTCIDPRLNPLLPQALGIPAEQFIWLRNAGNIITSLLSSTMRSLSLACAVKGGKEIAVIGHTDCLVGKTPTMELLDRFKALGIERHNLPMNVVEFFGVFASERQNVMHAAETIRHSPIIGPAVPVHGLMIDVNTGKLEWVVNGYQELKNAESLARETLASAQQTISSAKELVQFTIGEMKSPQEKIGDLVSKVESWLSSHPAERGVNPPAPVAPPPVPPKIDWPEKSRNPLRGIKRH